MPTSTVPAVWSALHALLSSALEVPVHYGPPMTDDGTFVCVGYADDADAVSADNEWAELGRQKHEERYTLACLAWAASGDVDMASRVATVYGLLNDASDAIAADYTLGGTCRIAHVVSHSLTPAQDASGSAARLRFDIAIAVRI